MSKRVPPTSSARTAHIDIEGDFQLTLFLEVRGAGEVVPRAIEWGLDDQLSADDRREHDTQLAVRSSRVSVPSMSASMRSSSGCCAHGSSNGR